MWRHSSIADSRLGQLSSSAPELPVRAASAPTLAIAGVWYCSSPRYTDAGHRPVPPLPNSHRFRVGEPGLERRDARGDGEDILFQRGNVPTVSLHQESILTYPDGPIFDVIMQGKG